MPWYGLTAKEAGVSAQASAPLTALVTGASRGIGRAIAIALGRCGFNVAINYASNREAALECARLVRAAGGEPFPIQGDIALAEDRQRLIEQTLAHFGAAIHMLINNAGVAPAERLDLLKTSPDSFDRVLATNLRGPFFLTQAVARHMIDAPPPPPAGPPRCIVNISSLSAYAASTNRGEYCIAKAGLAMLTRLFAARLAPHHILVYEIRPGIIATDMTAPSAVKARYDDLIHKQGLLPLARWGTPQDVAAAVTAIAEGRFPYSTGQVLDVDGGFHLPRL